MTDFSVDIHLRLEQSTQELCLNTQVVLLGNLPLDIRVAIEFHLVSAIRIRVVGLHAIIKHSDIFDTNVLHVHISRRGDDAVVADLTPRIAELQIGDDLVELLHPRL